MTLPCARLPRLYPVAVGAMWFKGDPPKGTNVHRYVTDWEQA